MPSLTELALFLGLCLCATAAGVGVLRLVGYPRDLPSMLLLAPVSTNALWVLLANVLMRWGHAALREVTPALWALTLILAVVGVVTVWRRRGRAEATWHTADCLVTLGGVAVAVGFLASPPLATQLIRKVSHIEDAYNYTVVAALAWDHGMDLSGPMPPIERLLAEQLGLLTGYRNHAVVLLALFSPLVKPGEPVTVRALFVCWSFVVLATSLAFYDVCRRAREGRSAPLATAIGLPIYLVVTMGLGWASLPALMGNWDNVVAVSLCPVLAGLALRFAAEPGYALLLGSLAAYGVYGYVELALAVALLVAPFYAPAVLGSRGRPRTWVVWGGAAAVAALWLAPGARLLGEYVQVQWTHSRGGVGLGAFQGLVDRATQPGTWWAFGPEWLIAVPRWVSCVAAALTAVVMLGVVRMAGRGSLPELVALGLAMASTAYVLVVDRYAYGVYKVLTVSWWLWGRALTEGLRAVLVLSRRAPPGARRQAAIALTGAVGAVLCAGLYQCRAIREAVFFPESIYRRLPTVNGLFRLRKAASREVPGNFLLGGYEPVHAGWVSYALRSTPMGLFHLDRGERLRGSSPWDFDRGPWLSGMIVPARTGWMHTGLPRRFETPDFILLADTSGAFLEKVENPNGLEADGMWLGPEPVTLTILAETSGPATLEIDAAAGPAVRSARQVLALRDGAGRTLQRAFERRGHARFELDLRRGVTVATLAALDAPTETAAGTRIIHVRAMALERAPSAPIGAAADFPPTRR